LFDILIRHTDKYLYQAKNEGSNKVVGEGCAGFTQKPFYMNELSQKIEEILKED